MFKAPILCFILVVVFSNTPNASNSHFTFEIPSVSQYSPTPTSSKAEYPQPKILDSGELSFGNVIKNLYINTKIRYLDFSPSGRFLAIGGLSYWEGGYLSLWDLSLSNIELKWQTSNALQNGIKMTNPGIENGQESLAFSPDEKILASAGWNKYIHLWNVSDGTQIISFPESKDRKFQHLLFTRDGTEIIASTNDGYLTFWNVTSGALQNEFLLPDGESRDIALSSNGALLATGRIKGGTALPTVFLWNISTNEPILVKEFTGHYDGVRSLDFSSDDTLLASGGVDGAVRIWNLTSMTEIKKSPLYGHNKSVTSVKFSPKGTMLVSSGGSYSKGEQHLRFWGIPDWENFHTISRRDADSFLAFFPTGDFLASSCFSHQGVDLLNVARIETKFQRLKDHTDPITSLAFGPNGELLASADGKAIIKLWNVSDQRVLSNFTGSTPTVIGTSLSISPDGQWLVSGSSDKIIRLWNVSNGQIQENLTGHESSVVSVVFSPAGQWLASADIEGTIKIWNVTDFTNITTYYNLTGHFSAVTSLKFSSDGRFLASGSDASNILLWNLTSGKIISTLLGHKDRITSLAFSPESDSLFSGSWDRTAKKWAIPSGELSEIEHPIEHPTEINSLDYSFDGQLIATGGSDGLIRIWNATSGILLTPLLDHLFIDSRQEILSLSFSPGNSSYLAAGGSIPDIFLYDIYPLPFDSDWDGMTNSWENDNELDPLDFWDSFTDSDKDGLLNVMEYWLKTDPNAIDTDTDELPDHWEYIYHTKPSKIDGSKDVDQDGLRNLYEFQMGLNSFVDDSSKDLDNDTLTNLQEHDFGSWANQTDSDSDDMPDWWEFAMSSSSFGELDPLMDDSEDDLDIDRMSNIFEYNYNFNAANPDDALFDADFDFVNNLNECLARTNPRDFWDFPLTKLNILYILVILLVPLGGLAWGSIFFYRRRQQGLLVTKLKAPDYQTALRIRKSNLPEYSAYIQAKEEANTVLNDATTLYHKGEHVAATEKYVQAFDAFQLLGFTHLMLEAGFHLVQIYKESGTLTGDNAIFRQVPNPPYDNPSVAAIVHMLQAVLAEINNNWGAAENFWKETLLFESLKSEFRMICQGALIECAFRTWFYDQSDHNQVRVLSRLDEWQQTSDVSKIPGSECPIFLFRARLALASYQYNEVAKWLERCIQVAEDTGLLYYQQRAKDASEQLANHKERIEILVEAESLLSPEEKGKLVQQYIRKAVTVVGEWDMTK
jgi:WD40 repeat protein